jgi:hypothetical protein
MEKMKLIFCLFFGAASIQVASQSLEFSGEINLKGLASTKEILPFWMSHNQRGRISDSTNAAGWVSGKGIYEFNSNRLLEFGAGVLYQDGISEEVFLDELYASYQNSWLEVVAGRKQHTELYNGLSAVNGNILWTLNARPIPGIQLRTTRPIFFSATSRWGFEASLSEFFMENDRFVKNARIHNKSVYFIYNNRKDLEFKIGIQHFAEYGGTSRKPEIGKQPDGFIDYLRVFAGYDGGENALVSDQENALGNHLGSYEIRLSKTFKKLKLEFLYSHLFEDASGMAYYNYLDGRYGIFADFNNKTGWINSLMYEFYYTNKHYTSNASWVLAWDNYFNNGIYESGWTYENRVIGLPFFTTDFYDDELYPGGNKIDNNRIIVHHFGVEGWAFNKLPYKLLLSYRKNYGGDYRTPPSGFKIPQNVLSTYLDLNVFQSFMELNLEFGADISSENTNLGAGIKIRKEF